MSGTFELDWAALAVSLFNTLTGLWLGMTIALNAERRTLGVWLSSGGLLLGGGFFLIHSLILASGPRYADPALDVGWRVGWLPVVILPYAWYGLILWYSGYLDRVPGGMPRRHRFGLALGGMLFVVVAGLGVFANPFPGFTQMLTLDPVATPALLGMPALALVYPVYIVACIGLSLAALLQPGPSRRAMGALARQRARPWLVSTALALLIVSLMVAGLVGWVFQASQRGTGVPALGLTLAWFDLLAAGMVAFALILLGQAIVAYEVFTGRTLPRHGLARQYQGVLLLAAGYGLLVGWSLTARLPAVYSLLATAVLMTAFMALLSWRSFAEREAFIRRLRPFVAGPNLALQALPPPSVTIPPQVDWEAPFIALCQEILGARQACLAPLGPMAALAGPALVYPAGVQEILEVSQDPALVRVETQASWVRLDPGRHAGLQWAVPLWGQGGLIGVLCLGGKRGGGLYTQEEIELARAASERMIDARAGVALASRLMSLQRQRFREDVIVDQRARRILHDQVLPQLHTALIALSDAGNDSGAESVVAWLGEAHRQISDLLRELPSAVAPEVRRLGLVEALKAAVEEEWIGAFDAILWQVEPDAEQHAATLPPAVAEVLYFAACEAIRNAARHGHREGSQGTRLQVTIRDQEGLRIGIQDDGPGMKQDAATAGSGAGIALHSTLMTVLGGSLSLESQPGAGTRVILHLPKEEHS